MSPRRAEATLRRRAAAGLRVCAAALLAACAALAAAAAAAAEAPAGLFFDDFDHPDAASLRRFGWVLRDAPGHPGVPGARWDPQALQLRREDGQALLRLQGQTDGSAAGTRQAQICHQRKLLQGTYAARLRFGNAPLAGAGGDPVIQAFYAVSPLRHDFDPDFSEIDWEYLAQGGWGDPRTRLYAIAWQTVRLDPWQAHNQAQQRFGPLPGWHQLTVQVDAAGSRWFVDGEELARHGGRTVPVVPMALALSLWFSPGGLGAASAEPRIWAMDVDWVFHAAGRRLAPAEVARQVQALRAQGLARVDGVPAAEPPLASTCDF